MHLLLFNRQEQVVCTGIGSGIYREKWGLLGNLGIGFRR